jgi:glycosyltransferase involved in cell wall biosynthesis
VKALLTGMEWAPDEPGNGGLNRYFHGLVQSLPSHGVDGTALVSYLNRSDATAAMQLKPMAPRNASPVGRWTGACAAARSAFRDGADLLNVHFAYYGWPCVRTMPREMPLVVHFHGPWADELAAEQNGLRGRARVAIARRIELAVYRRATLFVTLSNAFGQLLHERYGIGRDRIRVIPGGVDLQPYLATPPRSEARDRLGWPKDRAILLTVRRLVRRVGLELLIDAMVEIRRACSDALLLIGGKGSLANELQQRIDAAGLKENVRLLGLVPERDLPLAYAAADVSVVPTLKLEGFGLVTAESLAAGTPVLGTPVGGTPEVLRELDPALVLEDATSAAIADRASAALTGKLRLPSRLRCRAHAMKYDWRNVAPQVADVYEEAVRLAAGNSPVAESAVEPNLGWST